MKSQITKFNFSDKIKNLVDDFIVEPENDLFDLPINIEKNNNEEDKNQKLKFKFIKNNEKLYSRQSEASKLPEHSELSFNIRNQNSNSIKNFKNFKNSNQKDEQINTQASNEIKGKINIKDKEEQKINKNDDSNNNEFANLEEGCHIDEFNECLIKSYSTLEGKEASKRSKQKNDQRPFLNNKEKANPNSNLIKHSNNCFQNSSSPDKVINHLLKTSIRKPIGNVQKRAQDIFFKRKLSPSNDLFSKNYNDSKSNNNFNFNYNYNFNRLNQTNKAFQDNKNYITVNNSEDSNFQIIDKELRNLKVNRTRVPMKSLVSKTLENNQLNYSASNSDNLSAPKGEIKILDNPQSIFPNQILNLNHCSKNQIDKKVINYNEINKIDENDKIDKIENPKKQNETQFLQEYSKCCTKLSLDFYGMKNILKKMKFISSSFIIEEEQALCKKLWEILNGNLNKIVSSHNLLIMLMIISRFLNNLNEALDYSLILCQGNKIESQKELKSISNGLLSNKAIYTFQRMFQYLFTHKFQFTTKDDSPVNIISNNINKYKNKNTNLNINININKNRGSSKPSNYRFSPIKTKNLIRIPSSNPNSNYRSNISSRNNSIYPVITDTKFNCNSSSKNNLKKLNKFDKLAKNPTNNSNFLDFERNSKAFSYSPNTTEQESSNKKLKRNMNIYFSLKEYIEWKSQAESKLKCYVNSAQSRHKEEINFKKAQDHNLNLFNLKKNMSISSKHRPKSNSDFLSKILSFPLLPIPAIKFQNQIKKNSFSPITYSNNPSKQRLEFKEHNYVTFTSRSFLANVEKFQKLFNYGCIKNHSKLSEKNKKEIISKNMQCQRGKANTERAIRNIVNSKNCDSLKEKEPSENSSLIQGIINLL